MVPKTDDGFPDRLHLDNLTAGRQGQRVWQGRQGRSEQPSRPVAAVLRRVRPRPLALVVVLLIAVLAPAEVSYGRALSAPGSSTFAVRTVDWLRDHGGGPLVDLVENVYYRLHAPSGAAPDPLSLPPTPASTSAAVAGAPAPLPPLPGYAPLPGEGQWQPGPSAGTGTPAMYSTFLRPDASHPSVVAGVARFTQSQVAVRLIPGLREPSGPGWPEGGQVPTDLRSRLIATFNSGFKMKDARGGFVADGRTAAPLVDGAASLVIDPIGHVDIGEWGRDLGPDVAKGSAVRQNLKLVVDRAALVWGLDSNPGGSWGADGSQLQYTWRSGAGVDANGDLLYVGGDKMTLHALAQALRDAGAVRGMQLDMHSQMVDLFSYPGGADVGAGGVPLLPSMPGTRSRYLVPDQRDFFAVTRRADALPAPNPPLGVRRDTGS